MFCLTLSFLSWDVLSALGRSVSHCLVRAGLSGLSVDARVRRSSGAFRSALECFGLSAIKRCFQICAGMSGLELSDLSLAGLRL